MMIHKRLTTPDDPLEAVLAGIPVLLAQSGVAIAVVEAISHGTTLVTNAVIKRKGAVTGMLVTEGFRDILDMGLEQRYDLFDLHMRFSEPLAPRGLPRKVAERVRYYSSVALDLDLEGVRDAVAELVAGHGIEALAVCFLHSYANRSHEARALEAIGAAFPDLYVSTSTDVFPNVREYERWTTTTINAYTQPMFDRDLGRLEDGLRGVAATLTDANLVLGYLDPGFFLGGEIRLDVGAAEAAVHRSVAGPMGVDLARAAWSIHEIANEDMARAFRIHAGERGFDYRNCSMVAYGGSGPSHALAIARKFKIPRAIFPIGVGVMLALGLLVSPLSFEIARSHRVFLDDLDADGFEAIFAPVTEEASGFVRRAGIADGDIRVSRKLDMRYQGQGYEIEVPLPPGESVEQGFARITDLFERQYAKVFAASKLEEALEVVNLKVEATGPQTSLHAGYSLTGGGAAPSGAEARKGTRPAYVPQATEFVDCPVYDRYALIPRAEVVGPALNERRESTCVIGAGDIARVDANANLIVELSA
jgi:N-methylhydantoinase A/oxoprolinase/acetone carboxylase beta subunit